MKNQIELIFVILATIVLTSNARSLRTKTCKADSFQLTYLNIVNSVNYDENYIVFFYDNVPEQPIPSEFDDDKDYKNYCLKNTNFKIAKSSNPSVTIKTINHGPNDGNNVRFDNLEYLTEYVIQSSYNQNSPSTQEVLSKSIKMTTCFGEPSKVNNLRATVSSSRQMEISWDKPTTIKATNVCYYQLKIKSDTGIVYDEKISDTKKIINIDVSKSYKIEVISFNSRLFNGRNCYAVDTPTTCQEKGSAIQAIQYIPTTTTAPTTTPNGSSTTYQISYIYLFSIVCSFISFFFKLKLYILLIKVIILKKRNKI